MTALKQGTVALWFHRQTDSDSPAARDAFTECDRLGAATESAQFRIRLLAEDATLVALATSAFDAVGPIRRASTRTELAEGEQELQDALNAFMAAAAAQVH